MLVATEPVLLEKVDIIFLEVAFKLGYRQPVTVESHAPSNLLCPY